ncbi:MAG TPA: type II CAAX endopeptidase family protein [Anaerolineales bacterium]|nr:type II CAAX endopeptidase family protein [Anaerolineales bacterium]
MEEVAHRQPGGVPGTGIAELKSISASPPVKERFAMNISKFATHRPGRFILILTIAWVVLLLAFMITASTVFNMSYGDAITVSIARLAVTACVLLLVWRLDWLKASGISRPGSWHVWLLALGGLVFIAGASLYSFYGSIAFDLSSLLQLPDARTAVITHFVAGLSEEILFRGLLLYALIRVWGSTTRGILGSVLLSSVLFALVHLTQVFTYGTSLSSALVLVLQAFVLSIWWGALVVMGGSIWPAVIIHFMGNTVVVVQGLNTPVVEPVTLAYTQLLWLSLPLGLLAISLLSKTALHPVVAEVP